MASYLFVHFTGEQENGEQIYFSVSKDGLHWEDLNNGKPVLVSDIGEKGARDPFIIKDEENDKYYIIATDLRIEAGKGWDVAQYEGSRDLMVWESTDLVNWSQQRACTVGVENAGCVWAPESIYDNERQEFLVFWASMVQLEGDPEPKQRMYASYTTDFKTFSQPFIYLELENHVIDMNIVYDKGWYYRFVKDETTKNIRMDRVKTLNDKNPEKLESEVLDKLDGVEGPQTYQLPDGSWCLIVDQFALRKGYLPLVRDELGAGDFRILEDHEYDMGELKKRHGSVIKITNQEYHNIKKEYKKNNN